ncbi:MAG: UbiH/UbiF family hydroxylase [Zoogloeaceae bacterium]|jgi:ubiquinone biosynthesis UbiH/UbiF/VisC/COQ6 family hydroxylase|nr:UbiH/UbiF family hydroxylase [Zoogloeaceae bacterium]
MQPFDLIIVGGGLTGTSLAAALRESRLRIALIEAQASPALPLSAEAWDSRVYAISPANAAFLARIGVWAHLDPERMAAVRQMRVQGDRGGSLTFSAFETGVQELAWIMESSLIARELREGIKRQANLTRFCPAAPLTLDIGENAATLTLKDGQTLTARLVVGADGRDSWVRQQTRLTVSDQPYRTQGVVANFTTEKPHRGTAWQWFRDDGALAWLPLPGKRISIVWSTPDDHAATLLALSPEALAERVAEAGGHLLGKLAPLTPAAAFPLRLIRVPRTVAPRLALAGDAAHGIHPLSGHGVNLGFQDTEALAHLLNAAPPWQDIGEARFLERFQRARKEETLLLQSATDAIARLFDARAPAAPLFSRLANFGLTLTDRALPLKNLLARYALGAL